MKKRRQTAEEGHFLWLFFAWGGILLRQHSGKMPKHLHALFFLRRKAGCKLSDNEVSFFISEDETGLIDTG